MDLWTGLNLALIHLCRCGILLTNFIPFSIWYGDFIFAAILLCLSVFIDNHSNYISDGLESFFSPVILDPASSFPLNNFNGVSQHFVVHGVPN